MFWPYMLAFFEKKEEWEYKKMPCARQKSCARLIRVIFNKRSITRTFSENGRKFIISRVCYIGRFCKGLLSPWRRALVQYIEGSYYGGLVLSIVYYLIGRNFRAKFSSLNEKFVTFARRKVSPNKNESVLKLSTSKPTGDSSHLDKLWLCCWAKLCRAKFLSPFKKFNTFARQSFAR